jgi:hypothetical protein
MRNDLFNFVTANGDDVAAIEDDDIWDDASDSPGHASNLDREWIHRQNQFHKVYHISLYGTQLLILLILLQFFLIAGMIIIFCFRFYSRRAIGMV